MKNIKVITWNVKGTGCQVKRRRLELALKNETVDVIFLQETHQKSADSNRMFLGWTQIYEKAYGHPKARGVATFISTRLGFDVVKTTVIPHIT